MFLSSLVPWGYPLWHYWTGWCMSDCRSCTAYMFEKADATTDVQRPCRSPVVILFPAQSTLEVDFLVKSLWKICQLDPGYQNWICCLTGWHTQQLGQATSSGMGFKMSCLMTKPANWHVRPAKTQVSLGFFPVWSVFVVRMKKAWVLSYPLSTQWRFWLVWVDARLIWVFPGRTYHVVGFVVHQLKLFHL